MADRSKMKLGRKAVKTDSRTLKLGNYLTAALPPPPSTVDWTKGTTNWGMMLNDSLGDCTIAGGAHAIQVWTLNTATMYTMPNNVIEGAYSAWDGYVPGDPSTDQGGIELDVLNDWKKNVRGFFKQHPLLAFADAAVTNQTEVKQAINLFGGLYIGLNVPNYIMGDTIPQVWDVPQPGQDATIDGGHCVYCVGYDPQGVTFISWGALYKMTWAFWSKFVDEAHALLGKNWLDAKSVDPQGFDLAQLEADLRLIV
jgi:hypothetical protein